MIWAGNEKNVQTFIENHLMNGTFTDNYGILNYVTSFLLNVNFNIVGISNYVANQLTKISCGNDNASTLWVCNYQDSSLRAGHYISLAGKEAERTSSTVSFGSAICSTRISTRTKRQRKEAGFYTFFCDSNPFNIVWLVCFDVLIIASRGANIYLWHPLDILKLVIRPE